MFTNLANEIPSNHLFKKPTKKNKMLAEVPIQCLQGFLLLAAGKQLSYEDLRAEARTLGSPGELLRFFSPQKDGKIIELNGRIYHCHV